MNGEVDSANPAMAHLIGGLAVVLPFTAEVGAGDLQLGTSGEDGGVARLGIVVVSPPEKKKGGVWVSHCFEGNRGCVVVLMGTEQEWCF